jgi:hypothetical protein
LAPRHSSARWDENLESSDPEFGADVDATLVASREADGERVQPRLYIFGCSGELFRRILVKDLRVPVFGANGPMQHCLCFQRRHHGAKQQFTFC